MKVTSLPAFYVVERKIDPERNRAFMVVAWALPDGTKTSAADSALGSVANAVMQLEGLEKADMAWLGGSLPSRNLSWDADVNEEGERIFRLEIALDMTIARGER